MKKGKCKMRKTIKKCGICFGIVAVLAVCSAYVNESLSTEPTALNNQLTG